MASHPSPDGIPDDFLEQILTLLIYSSGSSLHQGSTGGCSGGRFLETVFSLGLSLEQSNCGAVRTPEEVEVKPSALTTIMSMNRVGSTGAMALFADFPIQSLEGDVKDEENMQHFWEKWSDDGIEHQVVKLMEEEIGAALQFLQSIA